MSSIMVKFRNKARGLFEGLYAGPRCNWVADPADAPEYYPEQVRMVAADRGVKADDLEAVALHEPTNAK